MSCEIVKVPYGEAYPRNGNRDNPTRYHRWQLFIDGESHGLFARRKDALAYAEELAVK